MNIADIVAVSPSGRVPVLHWTGLQFAGARNGTTFKR